VPEESKKRIDEIKAGLKDGSFAVWKGPIMDNVPRLPLGGFFLFLEWQ
jgi:basic membrane protein A and related proteins